MYPDNKYVWSGIQYDDRFSEVIEGTFVWTNPTASWATDNGVTKDADFVQFEEPLTPVGAPQLHLGTSQIKIEGGQYDPISLAKYITDQMQYLDPAVFDGNTTYTSSSELLTKTSNDIYLYEVGTKPSENKGYRYTGAEPYWLGASQFAFEYGSDAGLGDVFALSYMHTPFFNNNQLSLYIYKDVNDGNKLYLVPQQSGVFLTQVQPPAFFQKLGFNISDLQITLTPDPDPNPTTHYIATEAELLRVIPKQYSGLQSLFPAGNRKLPDTYNNNTPIDSSTTKKIIASARDLDPQGHFLIELTFTATGQKYVFNDGSLSHIFGIVPKQYINDGYVFGDSSNAIPYQHSGRPFNLQNIRVRILDPLTKQPIEDLGENSALYLQLNKVAKK